MRTVEVATYEEGPAFLLGPSMCALTTWRGTLCATVPGGDPVPLVFRRDDVQDLRAGGLTYRGGTVLAGRVCPLAVVGEQHAADFEGLRLPTGVGATGRLLFVV